MFEYKQISYSIYSFYSFYRFFFLLAISQICLPFTAVMFFKPAFDVPLPQIVCMFYALYLWMCIRDIQYGFCFRYFKKKVFRWLFIPNSAHLHNLFTLV